jgi:acyl-CoA thioester hydrolase
MPATTRIRVRYKDTDTMSLVYYGNYLTYFEVARVEYLRERGLPMSEVNQRIHLPVVEAHVKYVKPARLDDLLEVTSRVSEHRRASFRFSYEIRSEAAELVASGWTLHACWEPSTSRMVPIPDWLRQVMPDADLDPPRR